MTTSRPSLLPWTSTRRVARLPAMSQLRMVTCKCSSAAASRLYGLKLGLLLPSCLVHESAPCDYRA